MARRLRLEYPGAIYHVMNRGDREEEIFKDDQDRERFLETLEEVCIKTGWQVHALCLMRNHFHLVSETPVANLVAGMKWFLGTYTIRFNKRHRLSGHLFSGRYKALPVDGSGNGYFKTVCDYVHLNPVRANLLPPTRPLTDYRWSSWPEYLKTSKNRWSWLRVDRLLGEYQIEKDSPSGRRALARALEARRSSEAGFDYRDIREDWCFGEESFRKNLLEQKLDESGLVAFGPEGVEMAETKAERMIALELKKLNWTESDLFARAKGDLGKVALAARLRAETTVSVAWIAARLEMGTSGYLHNRLYRWRRGMLPTNG